jgi:uncharacterized protein DUF3551
MKAALAVLTIGALVGISAPALAQYSTSDQYPMTSRYRAVAQDAFCLQGDEWGYPGNCQFSTYRQCMAAAYGTYASCDRNPMSYRQGYERD